MAIENSDPLRKFFNPGRESSPTFVFDAARDGLLLDTINIAIALGRPMLVTGPAGAGKSAIARGVKDAHDGAHLFRVTVTSRSEPNDLKWDFDDMQRLADSSSGETDVEPRQYLRPGVIWQVLNPKDARDNFGEKRGEAPAELIAAAEATDGLRILLIDEMDKGDIDFANDLLDVFDDGSFRVERLGHNVQSDQAKILIVITSNQAKAFSDAFARRCLPVELKFVDEDAAVQIGCAHSRLLSQNGAGDPMDEDTVRHLILDLASDDKTYSPARIADLVAASMKFRSQGADLDEVIIKLKHYFKHNRAAAVRIGGA